MKLNVVIVEHDQMVKKLILKILESCKHKLNLLFVKHVEEVSKVLETIKPDLLFTARTLLGFDALDVLRLRNKQAFDVPVFVMMSVPDANKNTLLVEEGMYDLILHEDLKRIKKEIASVYRKKVKK